MSVPSCACGKPEIILSGQSLRMPSCIPERWPSRNSFACSGRLSSLLFSCARDLGEGWRFPGSPSLPGRSALASGGLMFGSLGRFTACPRVPGSLELAGWGCLWLCCLQVFGEGPATPVWAALGLAPGTTALSPPVVDHVVAYRDGSPMSEAFANHLAPLSRHEINLLMEPPGSETSAAVAASPRAISHNP